MTITIGKGLALVLALAVTVASPAASAQSAGARAAELRHEKFELMGKTFKSLTDELKKSNPNKTLVASNAATMKTLSTQLPGWFPRGSGVQVRPKSEAKNEIWTDAAGFTAAASNFQVQASKLQQVAQAGDMDAVRAQMRATGPRSMGLR